jgi:hypothetical protein
MGNILVKQRTFSSIPTQSDTLAPKSVEKDAIDYGRFNVIYSIMKILFLDETARLSCHRYSCFVQPSFTLSRESRTIH